MGTAWSTASGQLPEDFLRFGILISDGSKWTNLDSPYPNWDEGPTRPFLTSWGGGGGGDSWDMDDWMWPLPPEGSLTFIASWPAYEVSESTAVVDATEIRARAEDAEVLWSV